MLPHRAVASPHWVCQEAPVASPNTNPMEHDGAAGPWLLRRWKCVPSLKKVWVENVSKRKSVSNTRACISPFWHSHDEAQEQDTYLDPVLRARLFPDAAVRVLSVPAAWTRRRYGGASPGCASTPTRPGCSTPPLESSVPRSAYPPSGYAPE